MQKHWTIKESKHNTLIVIKEQSIYKGKPKAEDLQSINIDTKDVSFLNDLFSIPYSYIKKVENQSGKNYIKIFFGKDSEEELYVDNEHLKNEIFEYLKTDIPNLKYSSELPSIIKYAKPQLFALLSITGIFIWSLYLAIQMESGVEYEIVGGRPGILGIILAIANLGVFKIIIGYAALLSISLLALIRRLKSRTEVEYLLR